MSRTRTVTSARYSGKRAVPAVGAVTCSGKAPEEALPTWHVVTSQGRVILGVYGSALLSEAQEQARKVEHSTGFPAFVSQVTGPRPSVGSMLP